MVGQLDCKKLEVYLNENNQMAITPAVQVKMPSLQKTSRSTNHRVKIFGEILGRTDRVSISILSYDHLALKILFEPEYHTRNSAFCHSKLASILSSVFLAE